MTTVTVPLTSELNQLLEHLVSFNDGGSKAEVMRTALTAYARERAIDELLKARREAHEGKYFTGDLRELIEQIPH